MNEMIEAHSALDEHGRIYQLNSGKRLLNWICAAVFMAFSIGIARFTFLGALPVDLKFTFGAIAAGYIFLAFYSVRFNQLATFLYPDRIISRGLFTQGSLRLDDVAGYTVIPSRGPPRLMLIPKNTNHKPVYVNKISTDDIFESWLAELPDLSLTLPAIRRKRRGKILAAIIFSFFWSTLVIFGVRQSFQQYNQYVVLQSRGVEVEGVVTSKSIQGKSHTHYLSYTYTPRSDIPSRSLKGQIEIDNYDYDLVSVGDKIPVFYDPVNNKSSYPSPYGLLSRINPKSYLRHSLTFWGGGTLIMVVISTIAWIADERAAKKPL